MDFDDIGPLQLLVIGFGPDATFEGLVLDELERLTARGLIRVIDLKFVTRGDDGSLLAIELSDLDDDEAAAYGAVIDRLISGEADAGAVVPTGGERSFGIGPDDLADLAADLEPGDSVGLLLLEHTWATELKSAIRTTGGYPVAQGFLTPESMLMVGEEVRAIAEAEAAIELADAVTGAAMLDALSTVAVAEDIKAQAAVDAVRALVVSGLIADAAAVEAVEALVTAELVSDAAWEVAASEVAAAAAEADQALAEIDAATDTEGD